MQLIRVAERLGASSRRPRHPFPAMMAGVNPGRVPVHRAPKAQLTSPLTSQHEHRTSTTVDELRQVIDHTAPVVAYNGRATTSPELNEAAVELGSLLHVSTRELQDLPPFTYKTCEIRPKASKTDTDMYPLSNQRVLNASIFPEISQENP